MPESEAHQRDSENITLAINWRISPNIQSKYATNILVQETPHEYVIMFFEAHPPLILTAADLQRQQEEKPPVDADCVARIVVSRERLAGFVNVLQRMVDGDNNAEEDDE